MNVKIQKNVVIITLPNFYNTIKDDFYSNLKYYTRTYKSI
jgi:hypothetical protein